jgi:hypothetical protein
VVKQCAGAGSPRFGTSRAVLALTLLAAASGCAAPGDQSSLQDVRQAEPCRVVIADAARLVDAFQDSRPVTMEVGNDQGWCSWYNLLVRSGENIAIQIPGASILRDPSHGTARARRGLDRTYFDYRPDPGYRGADAFAVQLGPGFGQRRVAVTVVSPSAAAATTPAAEVGVTSSTGIGGGFGPSR